MAIRHSQRTTKQFVFSPRWYDIFMYGDFIMGEAKIPRAEFAIVNRLHTAVGLASSEFLVA
jgi:hypothetical protein